MSSERKRVESNIEEIAASILRVIADSAPATPNELSPAYASSPPRTGARTNLDEQLDLPALVRSLHSLADQISPQKGASNLNDHRAIADRAPSTPSVLSPTHVPPPPTTEARSNHDGAFYVPALVQPVPSHRHQHPPQIGASNLNGLCFDWQQNPERRSLESPEMPFDPRRSNWEQARYDRVPGVEGLSALPLRTTEADSRQGSFQVGGGGLDSSSWLPPPSPLSPQSPDIPRQVIAHKDALIMGALGPSRADIQRGMPMNAVAPPHAPANSLGTPIFPPQFRAPEATPTAPHTGVPMEPQGRTVPASNNAIPEDHIEKTLVELLRPLFKEWLDSNMRATLEQALHVEIERAKNRK